MLVTQATRVLQPLWQAAEVCALGLSCLISQGYSFPAFGMGFLQGLRFRLLDSEASALGHLLEFAPGSEVPDSRFFLSI